MARRMALTALALSFTCVAQAVNEVMRSTSAYTGSLLDEAAYSGADLVNLRNPSPQNGYRFQAMGNPDKPYTWTMPTTNLLGAAWFYNSTSGQPTKDIDVTVDGTGQVFAQYPEYDGHVVNDSTRDPLKIIAWDYSTGIFQYGGITSTQGTLESYCLSNTVMRWRAPANTWDFSVCVSGGVFSCAGRQATNTTGTAWFSLQDKEGDSDFTFVDTVATFPIVNTRGNHRNGTFLITNAVFRSTMYSDFWKDSQCKYTYKGTNAIAVVGTSTFSPGPLVIGNNYSDDLREKDRANRRYFLTVRGSEAKAEISGAVKLCGIGTATIADGASWRATQNYGDYYIGTAHADSAFDLNVTGAGTLFDISTATCFYLQGHSAFSATDGATVRWPVSVWLGNGAGAQPTVEIDGDDTKVTFNAKKTDDALYVGLTGGTTTTMNMKGGFFGMEQQGEANNGFRLRLGHEKNSLGVLNMSGGTIRIPGGSLDIGMTGSGEVNVSGGAIELTHAADLDFGWAANDSAATSTLYQTGGAISLAGGGVKFGYSASTEYRQCIFRLDGGEFRADRFTKSTAASKLDFSADGGTIKPYQTRANVQYPFFDASFTIACGGTSGFTLDTDGFDVIGCCGFSNKSGEAGQFVKAGLGQYEHRINLGYDVSNTIVRAGTFLVGDATAAMDTVLGMEGGVFSMKGTAADLTLRGLHASSGTILVDAGDKITVTGADVDLSGLQLEFVTAPSAGASVDVFTFAEPLSAANQAALKKAICFNIIEDGYHGKFTYDASTGKVTYSVVPDVDPIGSDGEVTWTGTGSWSADANWNGGKKPTDEQKAVFVANDAGTSVAVDGAQSVGAVGFKATGYTLEGGTDGSLTLAAEQGAAEVTVAADVAATVDVPVAARAGTRVNLKTEAGAALTLSKALTVDAFSKSGKGRVELTAANTFRQGVKTSAGITRIGHAQALNGATDVLLTGDTLAMDAEGLAFPRLSMTAPGAYTSVVLNVEKDVTVNRLAAVGGFEKRGKGTLTVDVSGTTESVCLTTVGGKGDNLRLNSYNDTGFAADGSPLSEDYATGILVTEGELVLKGDGSANPTLTASGQFTVGMNITNMDETAQAKMTLDGVRLRAYQNCGHAAVGWGVGRSKVSRQHAPMMELRNGTRYFCDTLRIGLGTSNAHYGDHPMLVVSDSTLVGGSIYFESEIDRNYAIVRCTNSMIVVSAYPLYTTGAADILFNNCQVGGANSNSIDGRLADQVDFNSKVTRFNFGMYTYNTHMPTGKVEFVNGSLLRAFLVNYQCLTKQYEFVWDDSEWDYGKERDYDFDSAKFNGFFKMTVRGKGLKLRPDAGTTFTVAHPIVGTGDVRNVGAGTVAFTEGNFGFSGTCYAAAGATIDLANAGTLSDKTFGGAGTISGGTFSGKVTVALDAANDWTPSEVPTFSNCTLSGARVMVDYGRTEDNPLDETPAANILVAKLADCTGTPMFKLKSRSTGRRGYVGTFTVDSTTGEVRMNVYKMGTMLIVR